jgi:hypothetical protein
LELPSLLCRGGVGPFLHSSLGSLMEQRFSDRGGTSVATVTGPILPCAVRELVASTAHLLERSGGVHGSRGASPAGGSPDGTASNVPSRALFSQPSGPSRAAFHLLVHPGFPAAPTLLANRAASLQSARYREGRIGSDGAAFMNSRLGDTAQARERRRRRPQLRHGEVLSTVTWESEVPRSLSYTARDPREGSVSDA